MQDSYRHGLAVLTNAWQAALDAADPAAALHGTLPGAGDGELVVIAAGKAAPAMAREALGHYRGQGVRLRGVVAAPVDRQPGCGELDWFRAGHPLPDEGSVAAGEAVVRAVSGLTSADTVLVLLSGGASALMMRPDGLPLSALNGMTRRLMDAGADIHELNTVRRKLCLLKGGGLARAAFPARVVTRVLSDVVGDDLAAIGSGPTVPDPDGPHEAPAVLRKYGIDPMPELQTGRDDRPMPPVDNMVVASGKLATAAALRTLTAAGYDARLLTDSATGDSLELARAQALLVREVAGRGIPSALALVSGGETTVTLPGGVKGTGGRNSTFALALQLELWDLPGWHAMAADTDGIDGSSGAAGAFASANLALHADRTEARAALEAGDSGGWFARHGHALVTGPTGTNVNDLRIILVG